MDGRCPKKKQEVQESKNNKCENVCVVAKDVPLPPACEVKGARRKKLEQYFAKKASQELIEEELKGYRAPPTLTTEYRSNFSLTNSVPDDFFSRERDALSLKYPVYGTGSNAITIYSHGYRNQNNVLHPFKRFAAFTKSPFERFDVDTS